MRIESMKEVRNGETQNKGKNLNQRKETRKNEKDENFINENE
jgi:hypothetical protein